VHEIRAGMEVMQEFVADYPKGQRDLEALQELVATLETERPPVSKELSENEQEVAGKLGLTPEEYRHGKRRTLAIRLAVRTRPRTFARGQARTDIPSPGDNGS